VFCVFLFLCFRSGRKTLFETSGSRELFRFMSSVGCMAERSSTFLFLKPDLAFSSTSERHAPLSRDCCHPLVLPPKATIVRVTDDQSVVITRQRAFSPWAPVMATLCLLTMEGGVRGLFSPICCRVIPGTACVLQASFSGEDSPQQSDRVGFFCLFVVYSFCFSGHSMPLYCSNFSGIFVNL
jgi:hypothetical protein